MLRLKNSSNWSRRDAIALGSLGALGLGLSDWLAAHGAESPSVTSPKAKSCILIWLDGGPSHLETFDVKPDAPKEVRGPFSAIPSSLPGVYISELLPRTASIMDQLCLIRSMTSQLGEHDFGMHYMLTGYRPSTVIEYPSIGSVLSFVQQHKGMHDKGVLPSNIAIPNFRVGGGRYSGNGFLPRSTSPFSVGGDPAKNDFAVDGLQMRSGIEEGNQLRRRRYSQLISQLDRELSASENAVSGDFARAFDLLQSKGAKEAFQLEAESEATRSRYGHRTLGQSCLLARRLVERGVPFVTVNQTGWDTHADLVLRLKEGYTGAKPAVGLIPDLDNALSALIEDLKDRGMLDETLVVVMGEFGRTPKINVSGGRDHWPRVFSVLLAGGGVKRGVVIGSSDATAESPRDRPVTPSDLARTIYHLLGVDPQRRLPTADGREVSVAMPESSLIAEALA